MLLAIDSGNTNIVFAVYDEDRRLRGSWRAATEARRTADEYAVWLTQLMALEGLTPDDVDGAIIASVVPPTMHALTTLCRRYFMSWVNRWLDEGFAPVRRTWLHHAHGLGEEIEVRLPREILKGTFKDLDGRGTMVLDLADGTRREISAGDVYFGT